MYKDKSRNISLLVLTGIELIFFTVTDMEHCFGFVMNTGLITKMILLLLSRACKSQGLFCFEYCHDGKEVGDIWEVERGQKTEDGICHIFNVKQHKIPERFVRAEVTSVTHAGAFKFWVPLMYK